MHDIVFVYNEIVLGRLLVILLFLKQFQFYYLCLNSGEVYFTSEDSFCILVDKFVAYSAVAHAQYA
jgi:hypothetical protein